MYALGEFFKGRYYQLLLKGNPRMVQARSTDTNSHLESTLTLLIPLNPPKDRWTWTAFRDVQNWQPIAVHTNEAKSDDLLSTDVTNCRRLEEELESWKNSSQYQQLLKEFLHDLQTLRSNTGLDFEDDLEMIVKIEDALRARKGYNPESLPRWYSQTMADRLTHIADACAESRYSDPSIQRLYIGRLLHEITNIIELKKREHQALLAADPYGSSELSESESTWQTTTRGSATRSESLAESAIDIASMRHGEPNLFVYMMDRQRLSALLKSLRVYTIRPQFGSTLIIELHYDPINSNYFIRLFATNSDDPMIVTEPIRVNPIACGETLECETQQFEQNLRHLTLDREIWRDACLAPSALPTAMPSTETPASSTKMSLVSETSSSAAIPIDTTTQESETSEFEGFTTRPETSTLSINVNTSDETLTDITSLIPQAVELTTNENKLIVNNSDPEPNKGKN